MIDCAIVQPLIQLLSSAEWDIRKEAAWAISNATSGGTPDQLRYLLSQNCIPPLCELLVCADVRIIIVALEALENLLKVGVQDSQKYGSNRVANFIEDAGGLDKIEGLQVTRHTRIVSFCSHFFFFFWSGASEPRGVRQGDQDPGDVL